MRLRFLFFFFCIFLSGFFLASDSFAAELVQNYYRWYANRPSADVADPWPEGPADLGENTPIGPRDVPPGSEDVLRLRISLQSLSGALEARATSFRLQYAKIAGAACGGGDETWLDLGAGGSGESAFRAYTANAPADGTPLQTLELVVSDAPQSYEEDGVSLGNPNAIAEKQDGEWDWVVQAANVEPATEYCFRMVADDSSRSPLAGYAYYPKLVTSGSGLGNVDASEVNETAIRAQWVRQFGSDADDWIYALVLDEEGNVYVAGSTLGTLAGEASAGNADAFLRKYSSSGNVLWTRQFGTSAPDTARGLWADGEGIYVAGDTGGAFEGEAAAGNADVFLRKYDFSGNLLWTRQFGTRGNEVIRGGIAGDGKNVYLAGGTTGAFDGKTSAGKTDVFVRAYDSEGNHLWTQQFGTDADEEAFGVAFGSQALYVGGRTAGRFSENKSFGGGEDAFLAKLESSSGSPLWIRQFGTARQDEASALSFYDGFVYVGGVTEGSFSRAKNLSGSDGFVAKYDGTGKLLWLSQLGTDFDAEVTAVRADASAVYLTGEAKGEFAGKIESGEGDAFAAAYAASGGSSLWISQFGTIRFDKATAFWASYPSLYVAGYTTGTIAADAGETSAGGSDAFLQKYIATDSDGDGIQDNVDTKPFVFSHEFSDESEGGVSSGRIINRGKQALTVRDAEDSAQGVVISAAESGGTAPASIMACRGKKKISLKAGDSETITCP